MKVFGFESCVTPCVTRELEEYEGKLVVDIIISTATSL